MEKNLNFQNETLTARQIVVDYYDEEYNDTFFSSSAEAIAYIEQHNSSDCSGSASRPKPHQAMRSTESSELPRSSST